MEACACDRTPNITRTELAVKWLYNEKCILLALSAPVLPFLTENQKRTFVPDEFLEPEVDKNLSNNVQYHCLMNQLPLQNTIFFTNKHSA